MDLKGNKNKDGYTDSDRAMDTDNDEVFTDASISSEDTRVTKGRKGEQENPFRRRSALARTPPMKGSYSLLEEKRREVPSDQEGTSSRGSSSMGGPPDPFRRRDSIGRSPIRTSGKEGVKEAAPEMDKGNIKRPRENSEEDLKELKKLFVKLKRAINDISKEVHQNTRVEIKRGIKLAKGQADEIEKKWDALTLQHRERKKSKWEEGDDDVVIVEDTKIGQKDIRETRSIGTQVTEDAVRKESGEADNVEAKRIQEQLSRKKGWEVLEPLLAHKWPEKAFVNTSICRGGKVKTDEGDIVVIMDPKIGMDGKGLEQVRENFPDAQDLLYEGVVGVEYIRKRVQTVRSNGEGIDRTCTLYLLPVYSGSTETSTAQDIEWVYRMFENVKERVRDDGGDRIQLIIQEGVREYACAQNIRECLEAALVRSEVKGEIVLEKRTDQRKQAGKRNAGQLQPQGSKVVVKMKGKDYAETLKSVKEKVNPTCMDVKINRVRRTAKGDLLLEVEGGVDKANKLKREIERGKEDGTTVEHVRTRTHVMIWGIEPDSSEQDILEALEQKVGGTIKGDMEVTSLRPTRGGNLAATVSVNKRVTKEVLRNGTVRIGWSTCQMRERVNVVRCFRCLEFGHRSMECKGENKSNQCLNCGEEGHLAKDCRNEKYCGICRTGGHRADQMTCPEFRKLVNKRKEEGEVGRSKGTGGLQRPTPANS